VLSFYAMGWLATSKKGCNDDDDDDVGTRTVSTSSVTAYAYSVTYKASYIAMLHPVRFGYYA